MAEKDGRGINKLETEIYQINVYSQRSNRK